MKVRIVDYVANLGGGVRFVSEMIEAGRQAAPDLEWELVSHGTGLARYVSILADRGSEIAVLDLRPAAYWRSRRVLPWLPRGLRNWMRRTFGGLAHWDFTIPVEAMHADVVWLPWVHSHTLAGEAPRAVASFHDAISIEFAGIIPPRARAKERENTRSWLTSRARLVVSSRATMQTLDGLFQVDSSRFDLIRLSGEHEAGRRRAPLPQGWTWADRPFVLYPANLSPHKNHELLIDAWALWPSRVPLVWSGEGADLEGGARAATLRRRAKRAGCLEAILTLGYVEEAVYWSLLERAWAVVVPSLAEGGGSFPAWEALLAGVPVLCSDIPVLREQMETIGAEVFWFNPHDATDLVRRLQELETAYPAHRARFVEQVGRLKHRSWADVAREYRRVFMEVASGGG